MKFNKLAALCIAATMTVGVMSSCGDSKDKEESKGGSDTKSSAESADNSGDENEPAEGGSNVAETHTDDPMTVTSAVDLVAQMTYGWNLGNTMDAAGTDLDAEIAWIPTKVKTTQEMIDTVRDSGMNVLRVPVSWDGHISGDDYQIDPAWMDRVQEIVNYGIDDGMFVILNTHHEEWYMPTPSDKEQDIEQLKAVWAQIADRFKGYDEHLIFEGLNEPRLRGTPQEWTGTSEARDIINEYEKAFVETVRASGGNNADRCLMITGYAASSSKNNLQAIELPEDSDKLIISVHAYLPYSFALDTKGTDQYDSSDMSIPSFFNDLNELFISQGIPVIVGEFGSMNKFNTEDRVKCLDDYLAAASQYDIPCVWWDNYAYVTNGENFGLLNRAELSWYNPELIEVFQKYIESDPSQN